VRVADLGAVTDSVATFAPPCLGINLPNQPPGKLKDAVLIVIFKIPGANVIDT